MLVLSIMYHKLRFIYVFVCTTILVPILLILLKPLLKLFGITINWDTNAYLFIYWFNQINYKPSTVKLINKGYILLITKLV